MTDLPADWLTTLPGANDLGEILFASFASLMATSRQSRATNPVLAARLAAATPAQLAANLTEHRARFALAFAGNWPEYATALRNEADAHASLGLSFADWCAMATGFMRPLTAILFERLSAEPARLLAALEALQQLEDRSFSLVGTAFLAAAERRVQSRELALERRSKELHRWETVFERVRYGICIADDSGDHILQCNQAFLTQYGFTAHDGARSLGSLFQPEEWARVRSEAGPIARSTGYARVECTHLHTDGSTFPGLMEVVRIPAVDGDPAWAISIHDLSEHRQLEALRARSMTLEAAYQSVREASRLKSEFLANMSHELRTPLNSIIGFSELLHHGEVGELTEQQREFAFDIHTSGKHLLRLINDVLDLSKIEAGRLELHPADVSLAALSREVRGILGDLAIDRHVTISVEVDPTIDRVRIDAARLKQVLYNYLANAIKFSVAGGAVEVRFAADAAGWFRLEVVDHGRGISDSDQARLFAQFEQLDAGRAKTHGGTGLGLALTRRLVEAQGGTVGVRSAIGVGSTFFAVLPVRATADSRIPPSPRPVPTLSSVPRAPILVVDDDDASTRLMATALAQLGLQVEVVNDAVGALNYLSLRHPAAIVLDLVMPGLDGFGFLKELVARDEWAEIPVLVWTTRDLSTAERDQLLTRASGVLHKDGSGTSGLVDALRKQLPHVVPAAF